MAKRLNKLKTVPAKLWKRVLAYLLDSFIVSFLVVSPFQPLLERPKIESISELAGYMGSNLHVSGKIFVLTLIIGLLTILYWAVFEYYFQQTIGSLIMKIKIQSTLKKPMSFYQSFIRNITKISVFVLIIDSLYIYISRTHQRYLEKMSNTEVVEEAFVL